MLIDEHASNASIGSGQRTQAHPIGIAEGRGVELCEGQPNQQNGEFGNTGFHKVSVSLLEMG